MEKRRCDWCGNEELNIKYHDEIWGKPEHDDNELFKMLILEGMQAGLSWITILRKIEGYMDAFDNFDIDKILKYDDEKVEELMNHEGIIRNRLKIKSVITNAKIFREVQQKYGSFDKMIWAYVQYKPIVSGWEKSENVPASTELSEQISKDLKKLGFKFVGPTIIYAYMQAIGMVNDHIKGCYRYKELVV